MYRNEKRQVTALLETISEALVYSSSTNSTQYLPDCVDAMANLITFLSNSCPDYPTAPIRQLIDIVKQLCMQDLSIDTEKNVSTAFQNAGILLSDIYDGITAIHCRKKILFLPYMPSMWTALESIWKAAYDDPDCDTAVVPIPHYKLSLASDGTLKKENLIYEGTQYPNYVPIIYYDQYNIEEEHPDIIFIHNPYDDANSLTRVPEIYYSSKLKQWTDCLVFSTYAIWGTYSPESFHEQVNLPGCKNADLILSQSQKLTDLLVKHNIPSQKILTCGSPKIDHIMYPIEPVEIPQTWLEKTKGKKVFLLNTHLSYLFSSWINTRTHQVHSFGMQNTSNLISMLLNKPGCALIWRPHPLLESMLESRKNTDILHEVKRLRKMVEDSPNAILDTGSDYLPAFSLSDALYSPYSSLIHEYLATGKPIYHMSQLVSRSNDAQLNLLREYPIVSENLYNSPDFFYLYSKQETTGFPLLHNIIAMERFAEMICAGRDPLLTERLFDLNNAFANPKDSTCGSLVMHKLSAMFGG